MLPYVPEGLSCPGSDQQYNDGGLYQPPRGCALPPVNSLAHRLILWSRDSFLSLRATLVPAPANSGADMLSRVYWCTGNGPYTHRWWIRSGLDLFASRKIAQCMLIFSLRSADGAPLAQCWPHVLLYAFPTLALIPPTLSGVRENGHSLILIALHWPVMHSLAEKQPWLLPLRRDLLSHGPGRCEDESFSGGGLSPRVIFTREWISHDCKSRVFEDVLAMDMSRSNVWLWQFCLFYRT